LQVIQGRGEPVPGVGRAIFHHRILLRLAVQEDAPGYHLLVELVALEQFLVKLRGRQHEDVNGHSVSDRGDDLLGLVPAAPPVSLGLPCICVLDQKQVQVAVLMGPAIGVGAEEEYLVRLIFLHQLIYNPTEDGPPLLLHQDTLPCCR
jgi:hypothetical protein